MIIDAAMKLFAMKGFTSTSIQEIATESGISKGAFYLYFKSKDALLLAILQHHFEKIQQKLSEFDHKNLPAREKFIKQLNAMFETLLEHKEFIIMQTREQVILLNDSIKGLILKMHEEIQQFYRNGLNSIYGEAIKPYLWDLSMMLEGLFQSYIKILIFDKDSFTLEELTAFIMRRMDGIVASITGDQPILSDEKMERLLNKTKAFSFKNVNHVEIIIEDMKKELAKMDEKEDLEISLDVLESEINKENPRVPVIQGMLSNFKDIPPFKKHMKEIASFYHFSVD